MKKKDYLKQHIIECDLPAEDKESLLDLLNKKTDYTILLLQFLKIVGLSKKAFELFGIDPNTWLDKHH